MIDRSNDTVRDPMTGICLNQRLIDSGCSIFKSVNHVSDHGCLSMFDLYFLNLTFN